MILYCYSITEKYTRLPYLLLSLPTLPGSLPLGVARGDNFIRILMIIEKKNKNLCIRKINFKDINNLTFFFLIITLPSSRSDWVKKF